MNILLFFLIGMAVCHDTGEPHEHPHKETIEEKATKKDICLSKYCVEASHRIFQSLNEKVDPCQNFNEFACGGFIKNEVIPDDQSRWNTFSIIAKKIDQQGRQLLEAEIDDKEDFESEKMAKMLYKSCMDEENLENIGLESMKKMLKEAGGWPVVEQENWNQENFNVWKQSVKSLHMGFSGNYLFETSIYSDSKNNTHRVIYFDQPSLGLKKEYWDKGTEEPEVKAYFKYMVDTAVLFGANEDKAREDLEKVWKFEMKLANISSPKEERRNQTKLYNPTTLGEFPKGPGLPESWTGYVKDLLNFEDAKVDIEDSEKVIIYDKNFFANLSKIMDETDTKTLANYMAWRMVKYSMNYLNKEARVIRRKYQKVLTGVDQEPASWKRCTKKVGFNNLRDSVTMVYAVSSIYARKVFDIEAKSQVEEMAKYLRKAFDGMLKDIDWMDEGTKVEAKKKLDTMKQFMAYPEEFLDKEKVDGLHEGLVIQPDDYLGNLLRLSKHYTKLNIRKLRQKVDPFDWKEHRYVALVNAFYNPSFNNFEFPAGILQGAFFHPKVPKYLNYGGIGFVIGHEITHGFDDQGRQRDAEGKLVDWWNPETSQKYKEKAQCIIWQYGNYTSKQVGLNVNGVNTQGENIADNGGVKEAYLAYNKWVEHHGVEPGLPGQNFSSKQLFWISAAQSWCAKSRSERLKNLMLTDSHSPPEFRIIGPLSNNEDFARDFNCPLGSPMNPEKKCVVW